VTTPDGASLPSEQYDFEGLPRLDENTLFERRQLVF
jgi:hypothetical protein